MLGLQFATYMGHGFASTSATPGEEKIHHYSWFWVALDAPAMRVLGSTNAEMIHGMPKPLLGSFGYNLTPSFALSNCLIPAVLN